MADCEINRMSVDIYSLMFLLSNPRMDTAKRFQAHPQVRIYSLTIGGDFPIAFEQGRCSRVPAHCFSDTPRLQARI